MNKIEFFDTEWRRLFTEKIASANDGIGFTGAPIFADNAASSGNQLRTTEQAFGEKLHMYTMVDAINDKDVRPFRIDHVNTGQRPGHLADKQVSAVDIENALLAPARLRK